jgi:hypothetical protein
METALSKTRLRQQIDEFCEENWPDSEILLFGDADGDPYDEGFIGIGFQQHRGPVAVYDRDKCIDALADEFASNPTEDSDPYEDAVEWFSYNTEGSWVGDNTPVILRMRD